MVIGAGRLHRQVDSTRVWYSAARTPKTTTMPLQAAIRHPGTLSIPATGHDLDLLILADPSCCWTTDGPDKTCRSEWLCTAGRCLSLYGAGAAPLDTQQPHNSEQDNRVVACAIMCSTDAMRATDRDDAKRLSRYPRALRRARVESDNFLP